ncbi:MAG: Dna2/Cas4 domain-containing protein [Carboxylicivirga sp.]|jgi:Holliday junction resolvase-like predicted endonuclease|nr:Dna2/Cas4 domain-containing protein [Carboxylicivirga sp.]
MQNFDYTNQNHIVFLLLGIIIVALIFLIIRYKLSEYFKERQIKKRFDRGNKLELQAKNFLKSEGFKIVDYQSTYEHRFLEDDEVQFVEIQPDYIVKKNGKTYIVEVKSGSHATSARYKHTRRQLLEYDYVVENDGVYLLDMEKKELKLVQFKSKMERRSGKLLKTVIVVAIIGIAIPYWQIKVAIGLILAYLFYAENRF